MRELTDIYEIAILACEGVNYEEIVTVDRKIRFRFPDTVASVLNTFYEGKLTVNPLVFKHKIQDIRSVIFGMKKSLVEPVVEVAPRVDPPKPSEETDTGAG